MGISVCALATNVGNSYINVLYTVFKMLNCVTFCYDNS